LLHKYKTFSPANALGGKESVLFFYAMQITTRSACVINL